MKDKNHESSPLPAEAGAIFWSKVAVGAPGDCWLWKGTEHNAGYGLFRWEKQRWLAHRAAWALVRGDPGQGLVCHDCDRPGCVNPTHLFLGSNAANRTDASIKGRLGRPNATPIPGVMEDSPAAKLREWRGNSGLGTRQAAKVFGVSQPTYSSWENGAIPIKTVFAIAIARTVGFPLESWVTNSVIKNLDSA